MIKSCCSYCWWDGRNPANHLLHPSFFGWNPLTKDGLLLDMVETGRLVRPPGTTTDVASSLATKPHHLGAAPQNLATGPWITHKKKMNGWFTYLHLQPSPMRNKGKWSEPHLQGITHRKFNIATENGWLEDLFRGYVKLWGGGVCSSRSSSGVFWSDHRLGWGNF